MNRNSAMIIVVLLLVGGSLVLVRVLPREEGPVVDHGISVDSRLEKLIASQPENPFWIEGRAIQLFQQGHLEAAQALFEKAAALRPTDSGKQLALAHVLFAQGQFREAMDRYASVQGATPVASRWVEAAREAFAKNRDLARPGLSGLLAAMVPLEMDRARSMALEFERLGGASDLDRSALDRVLLSFLLGRGSQHPASEAEFFAVGFLRSYAVEKEVAHWFDEECIYSSYQENYADLIGELIQRSGGVLAGLEIERIDGELFPPFGNQTPPRIRLRDSGRTVEADLKPLNDWADSEGLCALLNRVVGVTESKRRFHVIRDPSGDQRVIIAFLAPAQRDLILTVSKESLDANSPANR